MLGLMTATDPLSPPRPATGVSSTEFRHAIGHFATGVTVVTSVGPVTVAAGATMSGIVSACVGSVIRPTA